jgi:hypothetical protein
LQRQPWTCTQRAPWAALPGHGSSAAAAVTPVYITKAMTGLGWHTTQKENATQTEGEREGGWGWGEGGWSRRHGLQRRSKDVKQQGGKSCKGTRATLGRLWGGSQERLAREVPTRECGGREAAAEQQRIARVVAVSSRKLAWCYMSLPPHRTPNTFRPLWPAGGVFDPGWLRPAGPVLAEGHTTFAKGCRGYVGGNPAALRARRRQAPAKVAAAAAGLSKNRAREGGSDEKGCWLGNRGLKSGRRSL